MKSITRLLYIALVSMLVSLPALAVEEKPDPLIEIQKELTSLKTTVEQTQKEFAAFKESSPDKNYVEMLENINQQLTSAWVPTSTSINILEVFIAVIAIGVAYSIFRQSREYNKKLEADREEHNRVSQEELDSYKRQFTEYFDDLKKRDAEVRQKDEKEREEARNALQDLITEQMEKMKSATAEQKEKIEKAILELKAEKAKLRVSGTTYITEPLPVDPKNRLGDLLMGLGLDTPTHVTCPNCKASITKNPTRFGQPFMSSYTCSACGHSFTA